MKHLNYENQKTYWERHRKRRPPDHPVVQAFAESKIKYIKNRISFIKKERDNLSLLDIGCGNGFFTYYFAKDYDTIALDFSVFMLKKNSNNKKICASATKLPFTSNSFDIAFCSNLMHHLDDPKKAVLEMKRVSSKYIILSEPNRNNPFMFMFGLLNKQEHGTLKFSLKYMKTLIDETGLKLISASNMGIILPNKTPQILLPLLKKVDGEFPGAFYNVLISEKQDESLAKTPLISCS